MTFFSKIIKKIMDDCAENKINYFLYLMYVVIAMVVLVIGIYLYPIILLILMVIGGIGYKVYVLLKRHEAEELQRAEFLKAYIVQIVWLGLNGLEHQLGIPNHAQKGFYCITMNKQNGVWFYKLFYYRFPNLPNLTAQTAEQLRRILDANCAAVVKQGTYGEMVFNIPIYVYELYTNGGILAITVIPLISPQAYQFAQQHSLQASQNNAIGVTDDMPTAQPRGDIHDDI
jgi:hypothetical protein